METLTLSSSFKDEQSVGIAVGIGFVPKESISNPKSTIKTMKA